MNYISHNACLPGDIHRPWVWTRAEDENITLSLLCGYYRLLSLFATNARAYCEYTHFNMCPHYTVNMLRCRAVYLCAGVKRTMLNKIMWVYHVANQACVYFLRRLNCVVVRSSRSPLNSSGRMYYEIVLLTVGFILCVTTVVLLPYI